MKSPRLMGCVAAFPLILAASLPVHRQSAAFKGEVVRGEMYVKPFGDRYQFALEPIPHGWRIVIRENGRDENLAGLTPPYHFVPNPRHIEGWHFRNRRNTGPNDGSVNAPQGEREFIFSPEVGTEIDYPPTLEEFERIRDYGRGELTIEELELDDLKAGTRATIGKMKFAVRVEWKE